jgi:hypothetical protein
MVFFTHVPLIEDVKNIFRTGYSIGHVRHIEGKLVFEHMAQLSFGLQGSQELFVGFFI